MIRLSGINKTFKVSKRGQGFSQAVKALFLRETELVQALSDVSFQVEDGEMVGYIGPNGAGKSTTIKIMCGILTPDCGECIIDGRTPWRQRKSHVRDIGVVFGQRSQLWWDVPVIDSFDLIKSIYRVDEGEYKNTLGELVELLDLGEILRTPTRTLSLGQRMRCEIAASLLHSPRILFLDEPTIGLDAVSKIAVRQFIKKLNREKKTTVILTTHDMQDIEALTNRIILIGKGRILLDSNLQDLKSRISTKKTMTIDYVGEAPLVQPDWRIVDVHEGRMVVEFDSAIHTAAEVIAHISQEATIRDVSISGISSEEMVAGLYTEYRI